MKNLLPILALLLLVGCTSEQLERCIEAKGTEIQVTWRFFQNGKESTFFNLAHPTQDIEPSIAYFQCYSDKAGIIHDHMFEEGSTMVALNKIQKDCFSEHHKEDSIRVLSLARKVARESATRLCNAQGIY